MYPDHNVIHACFGKILGKVLNMGADGGFAVLAMIGIPTEFENLPGISDHI